MTVCTSREPGQFGHVIFPRAWRTRYMSRKRNIMLEEGNNKYQLKEFLMETIGQILLVAFFVGKYLTPHCWAKLCSHLRFGLNQLNLLKKIPLGV